MSAASAAALVAMISGQLQRMCICLVGMQREADRAAQKIAELEGARNEVVAQIEASEQLLASPELLQDHPELGWERSAGQGFAPKLGAAHKLFKDLSLTDFRHAVFHMLAWLCSLHC